MFKELILTCTIASGCQLQQPPIEFKPSPLLEELKDELRTVKKQNEELEREVKRLRKELAELQKENQKTVTTSENWKEYEATAYTAFCSTGCTGITATGVDVRNTIYHEGKRVVAVDPNVIPLGSTLKVRLSDGTVIKATAQDTGGAIKGRKIDILHRTKQEARQFGKQNVEVLVID